MCGLSLRGKTLKKPLRFRLREIRPVLACLGVGVSSFFLLSGLAAPDRVFSAEPASSGPVHPKTTPVETVINSDHMLAENIENKIHFSGHVHLVKGHLTLTADSLDVFFVPPGKGGTLMDNMQGSSGSQKVQTMVARGHVVIVKDRRKAFAGKAVYIAASHLFVLTELPVVIEHGDRISGERITFFTRINKSLVQGHGLMLLNGQGEKDNGNGKDKSDKDKKGKSEGPQGASGKESP